MRSCAEKSALTSANRPPDLLGRKAVTSRVVRASSSAAICERMIRARSRTLAPHSACSEATRLACGRGPFGGAKAFDDPVVAHVPLGKEAPCQVDVFGGDPHSLAALCPESRRDILKVGHRFDIDPGPGDGHHDVRLAKAKRGEELRFRRQINDRLTDEVFACHAEMDTTGRDFGDNIGRGEEGDLNIFHSVEGPAVIAGAAALHDVEPGAGKESGGVFLQPPFRGNGDHETHGAPPRLSSQMAAPTAGTGLAEPSACASAS